MKKYEIVSDMRRYFSSGQCRNTAEFIYRIRALRDIPRYGVKAGDLGGWIAHEYNLSQEGDCWVSDDAIVCDDSRIFENALAANHTRVYGEARVFGNATLRDEARVCSHARVFGDAKARDKCYIGDCAQVFGNTIIFGESRIDHGAQVFGHAKVGGTASVSLIARVYGNTRLLKRDVYTRTPPIVEGLKYELVDRRVREKPNGFICIYRIKALRDIPRYGVKTGDLGGWIEHEANLTHDGDAWISGKAEIIGNALVAGNAFVGGEALISQDSIISGDAIIKQGVYIHSFAHIFGQASLKGWKFKVGDHAIICDNANLHARKSDLDSEVSGNTIISGNTLVCCDDFNISDNVKVSGNAIISCPRFYAKNNVEIEDDAKITSHSKFSGNVKIRKEAIYAHGSWWQEITSGDITGICTDDDDFAKYSVKTS